MSESYLADRRRFRPVGAGRRRAPEAEQQGTSRRTEGGVQAAPAAPPWAPAGAAPERGSPTARASLGPSIPWLDGGG